MNNLKCMLKEPCKKHKLNKLGYVAWFDWADKMIAKGEKEIYCAECGRWFFECEF